MANLDASIPANIGVLLSKLITSFLEYLESLMISEEDMDVIFTFSRE